MSPPGSFSRHHHRPLFLLIWYFFLFDALAVEGERFVFSLIIFISVLVIIPSPLVNHPDGHHGRLRKGAENGILIKTAGPGAAGKVGTSVRQDQNVI